MAVIKDPQSGIIIADTARNPLALELPTTEDIRGAAADLIMSASGIRKVFADYEESEQSEIRAADCFLTAALAESFASFLAGEQVPDPPRIALGIDSRYTGPLIAEIMIRVFIRHGFKLRYLFIVPAPEIMAYTKLSPELAGFAYVSASHNPIGHNGFKFGLADGAVLPGDKAGKLIYCFSSLLKQENLAYSLAEKYTAVDPEGFEHVCSSIPKWKGESERAYTDLMNAVVSGKGEDSASAPAEGRGGQADRIIPPENPAGGASEESAHGAALDAIRREVEKRPIGVVAELNGSARTRSIDQGFLKSFGVNYLSVNDKAREIRHAIIPEGSSLDQAGIILEEMHRENPSFQLAYVPDNDGDRGNIVYIDPDTGKSAGLEAQEVFSLVCLSELAWLVYTGELNYGQDGKANRPCAVVVNGPTSLRVERIAELFGVEVARSEVGEANVVKLAAELRGAGRLVRLLGEGSNGGNITHPSTVRDPLSTIMSITKLLCIRGNEDKPGLFEIYRLRIASRGKEKPPGTKGEAAQRQPPGTDAAQRREAAGGEKQRAARIEAARRDGGEGNAAPPLSLPIILKNLPAFSTSVTSSDQAKMRIEHPDFSGLKAEYERIFLEEWKKRKSYLDKNYGIHSWEEINYEGSEEKVGMGRAYRSGEERGGLKILFSDRSGRKNAFIWMRPSGTEAVFRVLADIEGNRPEALDYLISWQREMISRADKVLGGEG